MARRQLRRRRMVRPRNRFKSARKTAGLTQTQLAAWAGCTVATIYDIESGRNKAPSYVKVAGILTALHAHGVRITADEVLSTNTPHKAHRRTRRYPA